MVCQTINCTILQGIGIDQYLQIYYSYSLRLRCPSVRTPSVCHALTLYQNGTSQDHEIFTYTDSLIRIISSSTNSKGFTSSGALKRDWGGKISNFQLICRCISDTMDRGYYEWLIQSHIRVFDQCQNHRPQMTIMTRPIAEKIHFSEPTSKIE